MRILVCGSREFSNYFLLEKKLLEILRQYSNSNSFLDVEIISGHARGADQLAEFFAKKYSIKNKIFLADWDFYGKSAGFMRNEQMIQYLDDSDLVVAFWNKKSSGTRHTISLAKKRLLKIIVIDYTKEK